VQGFASGPLDLAESRGLIFQLVEHYPMTVIVIDALDECDPDKRADLFDLLNDIRDQSLNLVKIFVSSRDDSDIVKDFQEHPDLELSSDRNADDIALFVKRETEYLIKRRKLLQFSNHENELRKIIIDKITEGAGGMYVLHDIPIFHSINC
jgi:hypothetical protein